MWSPIVVSIFLINYVVFTPAFGEEEVKMKGEANYSDGDKHCTVKLNQCSVDMKNLTDAIRGSQGDRGPKGDQGEKGEQGIRGAEGLPGTCKCNCPDKSSEKGSARRPLTGGVADEDEGGSESTPIKHVISCKYLDDETKTDYLKISENTKLNITCNKTKTCLNNYTVISAADLENVALKLENNSFWLSEKFDDKSETYSYLPRFYDTNDMNVIEELQNDSTYITMKIRYYCKNSTVVGKNLQDSLHLLTWKEQIIGPESTSLTPFYYEITEDGCKDSSKDWNHTDINLKGMYGRLPILDFHIRDKNTEGKFYIQLLEICFG